MGETEPKFGTRLKEHKKAVVIIQMFDLTLQKLYKPILSEHTILYM